MKRLLLENLVKWKKSLTKKPLILKGARQVGKTYLIRKFANEYYEDLIEINFERDQEFVELFKRTKSPKEILSFLELTFLDKKFDHNTLLFFDEIQACSEALTALKFLGEEFNCDIICSGRMLGVAIATTSSFPVGYVETWDLYPMSFIEFLYALNVNQSIIDTIYQSLNDNKPIPEMIHIKINEFFKDYIIIGGMPEVVAKYVETKSYRDALLIQRRIVNDYLNDMIKYAPGADRIKAREWFQSIPLQLAKENKKFQYKLVKKGGNARYYESSLDWLKESGLIIKTYRLKSITKPLELNIEQAIFKVYFFDTGLLISQFDETTIKELITGNLGVFKGAIYENIAAIILQNKQKANYYYKPSQTYEIDFVIYYNGEISVLEVRSGKNTRSKSFSSFINKHNPKCAFRFSQKNIGPNNENIFYYPLYALEFLLNNEKPILY